MERADSVMPPPELELPRSGSNIVLIPRQYFPPSPANAACTWAPDMFRGSFRFWGVTIVSSVKNSTQEHSFVTCITVS